MSASPLESQPNAIDPDSGGDGGDDCQVASRIGSTKPRLFYGWYMVPVATMGMICTSPAQTYGVSAFKPYIQNRSA